MLLADLGVKNISLSYMGLRRRVKFSKPWMIDEKFDPEMRVFLDSGAYTVNLDSAVEFTVSNLHAISDHYHEFVLSNLESVEMVSEFDALPLGRAWIEEQRAFWEAHVPPEKFMVIWHPEWGTDYLTELAERYQIIGVPSTSLEGRNLTPFLNALAAKGSRLHGIGTKNEDMQRIHWDSVSSTSWISPQKFGETIVWTGNELKRYPKKYKDQARKRHRTLFTKFGFDADKIAQDDPTEVLRLSVWSYQQLEEYVNKHQRGGQVVTSRGMDVDEPTAENQAEEVDNAPTESGKELTTTTTRETKILPGIGLGQEKRQRFSATGEEEEEEVPVLNIRSESARVCDSCFLADKCPAYDPGSNCAYNIPITVRTREQFKALQYGLLEMQTQRVFFMKFAEDLEGGYADPNLSKEMGLLQKMMATTSDMEKEGFDVSLRVSGRGSQQAAGGAISRIFGSDAGQRVQALPVALDADNIIEGEIVSE